MDVEKIKWLLPTRPRKGMLEWAKETQSDELGPNLAIFNREALRLFEDYYAEIKMSMNYEQVQELESKIKHVWGSKVKCTYCGEEYYGGYTSKPQKGVIFAEGEDGQIFDGFVDGNNPMSEVTYNEGNMFYCPLCGEHVCLTHKSSLKNGRTYQIQVCSVEIIQQYTALVFWIISRHINDFGYEKYEVKPREALVMTERGTLKRFVRHTSYMCADKYCDQWRYSKSVADSFQSVYYDWPSIMHRKVGGVCFPNTPNLLGTTGEKTGICEYIKAGGCDPFVYIKTWQKYPQVENLLKSGFGSAVISAIYEKVSSNQAYGWKTMSAVEFTFGNWNEFSPYKILGIEKTEVNNNIKKWNSAVFFGVVVLQKY